ncbi:MAG TPA: A24 family peptidase [Fontimonas sp.]
MAAWAATIAVWDLRYRRVPNAALVVGLLLLLASFALSLRSPLGADWQSSLIGAALAAALTLPGYALRKLGAGDVKMAAILGAFAGWAGTIEILLLAALVLGLMAAAAMAGRRQARLPAAVALAAGLIVEGLAGPIWL